MAHKDDIRYEVRLNNFLYNLQKQPYHIPDEDDLMEIEETEYVINRMYGEAVKPVIELIQMGKIDEAKKTYDNLTTASVEPVKQLKKKQ